MSDLLETLAALYRIEPGYVSETGQWVTTPPEAKAKVLSTMGVMAGSEAEIEQSLRNAPPAQPADEPISLARSAFWPSFLVDQRVFGLSAQLYGLRSARNWGIGDFEDLARLAEIAAGLGADFIGVNPLHALFFAEPERISPYGPSSRIFLNALYIAPDRVAGFEQLAERDVLLAELDALRRSELVDYPAVHRLKRRALEGLFEQFTRNQDPKARETFAAFRREHGDHLANHALFEALSEHFVAEGGSAAWSTWPPEYRKPGTMAVRDFARAAKQRIEFHTWLQWIADTQLAAAQARARAAGMRIGLYLDLAVGISPDGSRSWMNGKSIARQARIGCPPDPFSPTGQDWGLVPFSPFGLAEENFEPFRSLLRGSMRHAGALRIDHAMGLMRFYWIPDGDSALSGAYVRYPFRPLLEAVAEESWLFRAIVVGEDLGTVPPGFSDTIVRGGLLSYQVLYFTRDGAITLPPHAYRREALVCAATHDLPTLKGWWIGHDIGWRLKAGRISPSEAGQQQEQRSLARVSLLEALAVADLLPGDSVKLNRQSEMPDEVIVAVHRFLARTPCRLLAVQLDDALGTTEQANLPGTIDEHPNWRRKSAVALEDLTQHPLFAALTRAVAAERPKQA